MALPPFVWPDPDEEALDDDGFMLRYVDQMPPTITANLDPTVARVWRPDFSFTAGESYWMNHCECCDEKQGDHYVQGADGPFWPYTQEERNAIKAERIEGPHIFLSADHSAGAMSDWRDQQLGISRPEIPIRTRRRKS